MSKGAFLFYKVGGVIAIISLISIYSISQYLNHDSPFPSQTISRVAQNYPEFIIFRIGTITAAALIILAGSPITSYFRLLVSSMGSI